MEKWQILLGLAIATMPDIASGVLAVHFVIGCSPIWRAPDTHTVLQQIIAYGIGALLGVLPDFDILLAKNQGKIKDLGGEHRSIGHHPLITIPVVALLLRVFSWRWAAAGAIAMFLHYVDDSCDKGGLEWLYPLSRNCYFFPQGGVHCYTPEGQKANPPPQLQEWLKENFLKICWRSVGNVAYTLTLMFIVLR